jgi:hypothetical protein
MIRDDGLQRRNRGSATQPSKSSVCYMAPMLAFRWNHEHAKLDEFAAYLQQPWMIEWKT